MAIEREMVWVTIHEAAEQTGLSESFIRLLASKERIPAKRVGQRMYLVDSIYLINEEYLKDPKSRRRCYRRGNRQSKSVNKKEQTNV